MMENPWDKLHDKGVFDFTALEAQIVANIQKYKEHRVKSVLDMGCGVGRYLFYLLAEGFTAYGLESSKVAVSILYKRLLERNLQAEVKEGDIKEIPYPENFFNAILCVNVLHHDTMSNIKKGIAEMYRVLNKGGILCCSVISVEDFKYGVGREIEPNTFVLDSGKESGIPHHFFTESEFCEFFACFEDIEISKMVETKYTPAPSVHLCGQMRK